MLKILADNQADRSTVTTSSEVVAMPATNLQLPKRDELWRSNGNAQPEYIDIVRGAGESVVQEVAIVDHNLSLAGTIQVQAWTDAINGADEVVDITVSPYTAVHGYGSLPYGQGTYGGYEGLGPLSMSTVRSYLKLVNVISMPTDIDANYWRVTLTDLNSYIQCSRIYLGQSWTPNFNYSYGAKLDLLFRSSSLESDGGQLYINRRESKRVMTLPLDYLDDTGQQLLWAIWMHVENHTPVIVAARPSDGTFNQELHTLYGRFDAASMKRNNSLHWVTEPKFIEDL